METSTPTPSTPASPNFTPEARSPISVSIELLTLLDSQQATPTSTPPPASYHKGLYRTSTLRQSSSGYQTSNYRTHLSDFPPELIALITHHLYYSLIPTPNYCPSPDPHLYLLPATSAYSPPSFEPTPSEQAREVFSNLCLVDSHWGEEGRKALWRNLSIGMPRAFQSVLQTIEEYQTGRRQRRIQRRMTSLGGVELFDEGEHMRVSSGQSDWTEMDDGILNEFDVNGQPVDWSDIGIDGPWKDLKQDADGIGSDQRIGGENITRNTAAIALANIQDALDPLRSPLLITKTLSFSRFRTAGLRRSVRQGSHERFVTPHRLLLLLRGTRVGQEVLEYPGSRDDEEESVSSSVFDDGEDDYGGAIPTMRGKLESVGFTEFMDSAISKGVLDELLFRGGYLAEYEEKEPREHYDISDVEINGNASPFPSLRPSLSRQPLVEKEREGRGYASANSFQARHLQSSHSRSRSPDPYNNRVASIYEESDQSTDEGLTDNEETAFRRGERKRRRRGRVDFNREFERRGSGSTFATTSHYSEDFDREESEDRGRDRDNKSNRGRQRNRSLVINPAFGHRSSSVPAVHVQRSRSVGASERSVSVPATRRYRYGEKKIIRVLEGSKEVRPIRALDLCGCVSHSFIVALESVISTYHLGPAGLFPPINAAAPIPESNYDSNDDDSGTDGGYAMSDSMSSIWSSTSVGPPDENGARRKLKRIYFPHLRRLGLSSALLPAPLLSALVTSFPFLTHLDLSSTFASPLLIKHLALAGQSGPGGRSMRLQALSLARCRLMTGEAIVGLMCGDCPPFTSIAGHGEDSTDENWGSGEVVMELIDLSLFGDATHPSPLTLPELRLIVTISPAFTSGFLRNLDLSSIPLTDTFLDEHFPRQPHLIELALAGCRGITYKAVANLLLDKAPGVEILVLSGSCRPTPAPGRRAAEVAKQAVMELHVGLLGRVASVNPSSSYPAQASSDLFNRRTNLRVVELDDKTLEAVQGGAGDWKVIWGKGRRGWYVDTATTSIPDHDPHRSRPRQLSHLPRDHPRRLALQRLSALNGVVSGEMGWHTKKMEVLRGDGMQGREDGLFAFHAFQV